jgi:hypothetical protein
MGFAILASLGGIMSAGTQKTLYGIPNEPKQWKDLSTEDKLERARGMIKHLEHGLGKQSTRLRLLEQRLAAHQHGAGGVATVPIQDSQMDRPETDYPESPPVAGYVQPMDDDIYF